MYEGILLSLSSDQLLTKASHSHSHCLAGAEPSEESEAADSSAMTNGWSSLATNKDTPIEYFFASDARFVFVNYSNAKAGMKPG